MHLSLLQVRLADSNGVCADDFTGWVVEYLVTVRNGELSKVGYVQTGFAGGTFLGRVLLAEPTKRFGERRMIFIYAILCLALELVFWLVPNIVAGAVAISLFGFFSGPFFATGVSIGSQIFPASIRSNALGKSFLLLSLQLLTIHSSRVYARSGRRSIVSSFYRPPSVESRRQSLAAYARWIMLGYRNSLAACPEAKPSSRVSNL